MELHGQLGLVRVSYTRIAPGFDILRRCERQDTVPKADCESVKLPITMMWKGATRFFVDAEDGEVVINYYSAGAQTSRINYQSLEFNTPIVDTLFARPANVKAVK